MGFSNEKFRNIAMMEKRMEQDPSRRKFYNWGPCEHSVGCPVMNYRLGTLPKLRVGRESCSNNPGINDCRMYQFFSNVIKKKKFSGDVLNFLKEDYDSLCKVLDGAPGEVREEVLSFRWDMRALTVDVRENGWK